jgi:putative salt-induced outer membrane protein YdiY
VEVEVNLRENGPLTGRLILLDDRQAIAAEGVAKPIAFENIVSVAVPGVELAVAESPGQAPAEKAPEPAPEEEAPKKWSGTLSAGSTWQKGATDTFDATAGATIVREWPDDTLTFKLEAAYGEVESDKNTQRALGELKWRHYWTERFYSYWLGGAEHDAGRQLDLRLRTNLGVGKEFINNERRKLSLEAGLGYRREYWLRYDLVEERAARESLRTARRARTNQLIQEIQAAAGIDLIGVSLRYWRDMRNLEFDNDTSTEDSVNVHASSHYEQQIFKRSLFSSDLTFEPDVDDISSYRVLSDLGFLTPLSEKMSLKIRLQSEYDSDPGDVDAENWEHKFLTGLEYAF